MSKIDSNSVDSALRAEISRARQDGKAASKGDPTATEEQIKKMIERLREGVKVETSALLKIDLPSSTAQLRRILSDELLQVMQQVPGFVAPQMSQPPTPDDLKQLMKLMQGMEKEGALQKNDAFAKAAATPEDAHGGFMKEGLEDAPSLKNWNQFVQQTTNAQGTRDGQALTREGLKEGQAPHELQAKEGIFQEARGAGLRSPTLVGDGFAGLNNKQKLDIMSAGFGKELATLLKQTGIRDPAALLKAASTPEGREALSKQFGLTRSQVMVHVARAEMMGIGAGKNGEQALRAQHLPALQSANIVTQTQLANVHTLPGENFNQVFRSVRESFSGFARAMSGERPVLKKDLHHWAKSAARKKSSLLDADWEALPHRQGEAEEVIMAWYLEHWGEMEDKRREVAEKRELDKEARAALARGDVELQQPKAEYDPGRDDGLICFFIERPNLSFDRPTLTEMVYVCLDPKTGTIDMKSKE